MSFVVGSFCFALASSVTAIVVKLASNVHFLDIPIDRSAHTIPTPTGGGIAFVLPYAVVSVSYTHLTLPTNREV